MLRSRDAIRRVNGFASEALSLRTPRARLVVFAVLSLVVLVSNYSWLENLSFWKFVGWESAPSIGLTRAYWLLLHGDVVAAWERNVLIFAVLAIGLPLLALDLWKVFSGRRGKNIDT